MLGGLKGSFSRKGVIAGRAVGWLVVMGNGWRVPATETLLLWIWASDRGVPQHDILKRTCFRCVQALYAVSSTGAELMVMGKRGVGIVRGAKVLSGGRVPRPIAQPRVTLRTGAKLPHLRYALSQLSFVHSTYPSRVF
jgi:hypothetical protein